MLGDYKDMRIRNHFRPLIPNRVWSCFALFMPQRGKRVDSRRSRGGGKTGENQRSGQDSSRKQYRDRVGGFHSEYKGLDRGDGAPGADETNSQPYGGEGQHLAQNHPEDAPTVGAQS